jgi:hypothetical protein
VADGVGGGGQGGDPRALRAGYERLRQRVLAGASDGWRLGHGVLAARGMAAWIAAWSALAPAPTPPPDPSRRAPASGPGAIAGPASAPAPSSAPAADEIVAVLGQMALAQASVATT